MIAGGVGIISFDMFSLSFTSDLFAFATIRPSAPLRRLYKLYSH